MQVAGKDGKLLKVGLKGWKGLAPLSIVVIRGKVKQIDEKRTVMIVDLDGIHVEKP